MLSAKDFRVCRAVWDGYMVHWSGTVYPCCNIDDVADGTSIRLGNAREQSLAEIDAGEPARQLRERHRVGRFSGTKCQVCLMTTQNQGYFDGESTPLVSFPSADPASERPFPVRRLEVELTDHCNLKCVMCWRTYMPVIHPGHENGGFFDYELFETLLAEFATWPGDSKLVNLQWIGEPMLHPRFLDFVHRVHDYPGMTASIVTNGAFLDEQMSEALLAIERPDLHIGISLNAGSRESFQAVQGRDQYELVVAHTKHFLERRAELGRIDDVGVQLKMVVMPQNEHEVPRFRDEWEAFLDGIDTPYSVLDNFHGKPCSTTLFFSPETGGREDAARRFHRAMERIFPRPSVEEQVAFLREAGTAEQRAEAKERLWQTVFLSTRSEERQAALEALERELDREQEQCGRDGAEASNRTALREERLGLLIGLAENAGEATRDRRICDLESHLSGQDRLEARELTRLASSTIRMIELRKAAIEDGTWSPERDALVARLSTAVLEVVQRWFPERPAEEEAHQALVDAVAAAVTSAPDLDLSRGQGLPEADARWLGAAATWITLLDAASSAPEAVDEATSWIVDRLAALLELHVEATDATRISRSLGPVRVGLARHVRNRIDAGRRIAPALVLRAAASAARLFANWSTPDWTSFITRIGDFAIDEATATTLAEVACERLHIRDGSVRERLAECDRLAQVLLEQDAETHDLALRRIIAAEAGFGVPVAAHLRRLLDARESTQTAGTRPSALRIEAQDGTATVHTGQPFQIELATPLPTGATLVVRRLSGSAIATILPPPDDRGCLCWTVPGLPLASDLWELALLPEGEGSASATLRFRVEEEQPRELFACLSLPVAWSTEASFEATDDTAPATELQISGPTTPIASGDSLTVELDFASAAVPPGLVLGIAIESEQGTFLTGPNTTVTGITRSCPGRVHAHFSLACLPLAPARYHLTVGAFPFRGGAPLAYRARALEVRITGRPTALANTAVVVQAKAADHELDAPG